MMDHTRENDTQVAELKKEIVTHVHEEALRDNNMVKQIELLQEQVDLLSKEVKNLVDLWTQARGVLNFIQWAAGIGGIIAGVVLFIKDHIK
jgi:hypothetical protein